MTEDIFCRICGRQMKGHQGLAKHEAIHVKHGEARYTGEKPLRGPRPIERLAPQSSEPTKKGRFIYQKFDGRPCEICGKSDFDNQFSFEMHRNHHPRKHEAYWLNGVSKGTEKRLVATSLGKEHFAAWLSGHDNGVEQQRAIVPANNQVTLPNGQQIVLSAEQLHELMHREQPERQVEVGPHECLATQVIRTLRTSLTFIEFAMQIQDMDPEDAMRAMAAIKALGSLPRHGRR